MCKNLFWIELKFKSVKGCVFDWREMKLGLGDRMKRGLGILFMGRVFVKYMWYFEFNFYRSMKEKKGKGVG